LEIADRLDRLAQQELDEVQQFISTQTPMNCAVLLIEACRCLDHAHVRQLLSSRTDGKLSVQDFDILVRGWNVLFALLIPRVGIVSGIPLNASVPTIREAVMGMMHFSGRYVVLSRTAEMVRHGMVSAKAQGSTIELELSDRALSDHFHDQVDYGKLAELNAKIWAEFNPAADADSALHLRKVIGELTFPWETSQGTMVGYTADPEIDAYFLRAVTQNALKWRDDAGIHPDAKFDGCSGETLTAVVLVLMSFYTKHIMFVEEAIKLHPDVNQHMSLTIWKTRAELIDSLVIATAAPEQEVIAALKMVTVTASDADYFMTEHAPGIPLVIELSTDYLLTPVSGIFRNSFNGVRMLRETASPVIQNAFREHREEWMAADLYALFQGPRFQCIPGQTKLRRKRQTVTDIDAAVFDNATSDLMLFQLKWQDFTSSKVRTQRSKAKNFTEQVRLWAAATGHWIDDFGTLELCRALKVKLPSGTRPRTVRLIAIGRSNARFRSYGYDAGTDVLALPWPQFVRLRYEIGPQRDFFELLTQAVIEEASEPIPRQPIPYLLERHGLRINFKDIWSGFDEDRANLS